MAKNIVAGMYRCPMFARRAMAEQSRLYYIMHHKRKNHLLDFLADA
jgi:hypothetical protein